MYSLLALECGALLAEAIVYGVYVLTFSVTIFVLLRRPSRTHSILATITILMFLLSTAHVGLLASTTLRHIVSGSIEVGLELRDKAYPEPSIQVVLECLNCILGDTIINWRAWVLWNRNRFVLTVPAVLLVAALGCNAGLCHAVFTEPVGEVLFSSAVVQRWGAGALSLTFSANIWGVSLVALRFRTYRKQVASSIPSHTDRSSGMSPTTVLLFLLETGTLYCCTLFVLAVTFITRSIGSYVVLNLLSQLTGLCPTLMIFLVSVWKTDKGTPRSTQADGSFASHSRNHIRTQNSAMVFAPALTVSSETSAGREEGYGKDIPLEEYHN